MRINNKKLNILSGSKVTKFISLAIMKVIFFYLIINLFEMGTHEIIAIFNYLVKESCISIYI